MTRTPRRSSAPTLLAAFLVLNLALTVPGGAAWAQDDHDSQAPDLAGTASVAVSGAAAREMACRDYIDSTGELQARVATQQRSLDTKQARIVALEESLSKTQEELSRLVGMEEKYSQLLRDREALQVQVETKGQDLQSAKSEFLDLSSQVDQLAAKITDKNARIYALRKAERVDQEAIDSLSAEVEDAQTTKQALELRRLDAEKATQDAQTELARLEDELATFVAEHQTVQNNYRNASAELRKYKGVLFSAISTFVLGLGIIAIILFLQVQRRKQAVRRTVVERLYTQKESADALEVMAIWDLIQQDAMLLGIRRLLFMSSSSALLILLISLGVIVGLIWFGNSEVPAHFIDDLDDAVIGLLAGIGGPVVALALMYQRAQSRFRDSIDLCANLGLQQILRDSELKDEMIASICDMPGLDTLEGMEADGEDDDPDGDGGRSRRRLIKSRYSRGGKTEERRE